MTDGFQYTQVHMIIQRLDRSVNGITQQQLGESSRSPCLGAYSLGKLRREFCWGVSRLAGCLQARVLCFSVEFGFGCCVGGGGVVGVCPTGGAALWWWCAGRFGEIK